MTAVWMRFQAELRAGWRAWLALAVLTGLAGGLVIATAAGARRTDSALARHLVAYPLPDAKFSVPNDLYPRVAALPEVEIASEEVAVGFAANDSRHRPVPPVARRTISIQMPVGSPRARQLESGKLLAGRRPIPTRKDEVLVDSRAARTFGVEPGDHLRLRLIEGATVADAETGGVPPSRLVELRVVGVTAATDIGEHPGGVVRLTPALHRILKFGWYSDSWMAVRLRRGAADIPAFGARVERIAPGTSLRSPQETTATAQRSIRLQAQALWLAGAFGAVLLLALVSQAFFRLASSTASVHPTLRALGMTRYQLHAVGMARAGAVALPAAMLSLVVAVALSPLAPIGLGRELEPDPGLAIDPFSLGLGAGVLLIAVLLAGALAAWRAAPARDRVVTSAPIGSVVADGLARRGLPATVVTGVRLALVGRRGGARVPVGATLLGAVLAVAVAATALTFSASLAHLFSTPRLYGQIGDYRTVYFGKPDREQLTAAVRSDPLVGDAGFGAAAGRVWLKSERTWRLVGVRAMDDVKGRLDPVVIDGRGPLRDDEILLGSKTFDALGVELGDTIRLGLTQGKTAPMRVVGRGVVEMGPAIELGEGAAITFEAFEPMVGEQLDGCCHALEVRFAPRADESARLARLGEPLVSPARGLPKTVADFGGVDRMPLVLSVLIGAIAAVALAHTLMLATRRRRRDLAILKALGFDRRQVFATVAWQATTFAAVGLLIGLPLGVALGRWAWNLFAEELGVVPEPVIPGAMILLLVPAAILLANVVAAFPARIAARTRPALVLRAE